MRARVFVSGEYRETVEAEDAMSAAKEFAGNEQGQVIVLIDDFYHLVLFDENRTKILGPYDERVRGLYGKAVRAEQSKVSR